MTAKQLSQLLMKGEFPITPGQGYQPFFGHAGVDFGKTGNGTTSVYSPVSGTVIRNTDDCGKVAIYDGRNTIILAHMKSRTTVGSTKEETIKAGAYVGLASDVQGTVSNCKANGAHLHIEIRTGRNTSMADPTRDNRTTTIDPLSYKYDVEPPTISITSPKSGSTLLRSKTHAISWSAVDFSGLGDVAVELLAGSTASCSGKPTVISTLRAAGSGYASSIKWTIPSTFSRGSYKLKVAVRDTQDNWGCVMIPITVG
jgi:hypothetical protein